MWQPNGYVLFAGSKKASSLSPGSTPSGSGTGTYAKAATRADDFRGAGGSADPAVAFDRHLRVLPPSGRQRRRRTKAAHFDVHGQAEPDQAPLRARGVALLLQLLPVRILQRQVEGLLVVAGVVDGA